MSLFWPLPVEIAIGKARPDDVRLSEETGTLFPAVIGLSSADEGNPMMKLRFLVDSFQS